jgi:hypothetical protein
MNKLEPIHDQAIDLFVAGKKQHEIAKELNVNVRTLRRWSDSELFMKELHRQHEQSRKLDQDARAEFNRRRFAFHELVINQLETLLKDPATPPQLRAACLKIGIQDMQATSRQTDAQTWREHVYEEKKAERLAKEAASREDRATITSASNKMDQSTNLIEHLLGYAAKAGKTGQTTIEADSDEVEDEDVTPNETSAAKKADKSGHPAPAIPPIVKPVQPFRYPRPEKKDAQPATQSS